MKRALLAGVVAAILAVLPQTVHSDAITPPGCDTWADGGTWSDNCWAGRNGSLYERNGNMTTGIQTILFYHSYLSTSYNPISIDGFFGNQTHNRMLSYQSDHGLAADGVVGSSTWHSLSQHLDFTIQDGNLEYFLPNSAAPFNTHMRGVTTTKWFEFAGSCVVSMDIQGPVFC